MDLYLTAPDGGRIHFPMNPERVTMQDGVKLHSFEIIILGDIPMPRGRLPTRISWDGVLPGAARRGAGYVKSWRAPKDILADLEDRRGQKLRLLVTETPINIDVYIDTLEHTWSGGHGDAQYAISLVEARELVIPALESLDVQPEQQPAPPRPAPPPPKTYTVKSGDSLWAIAKQTLGDGSRWPEIHNANASTIGKDPNLIYPGQVFRIP